MTNMTKTYLKFIIALSIFMAPLWQANAVLVDADKAQLGQEANLLLNGGFENGIAGWGRYNEAAENNTFTDSGDLVTATAHSLINGDSIVFTTITTTTGISTNTLYYVISATANTFQVAATSGGSAIDLTTDGSGQFKRTKPLLPPSGGSPNVTIGYTSNTPIEGKSSGVLTKDAAMRIGEGWHYAFTLPANAAGTVQEFSLAYYVNSGTYNSGDATFYLYDDTNDTLQYTLPLTNTSSSAKQYFNGSFIAGATSYKAVIAVTGTNASAFALKLDSFRVYASTPKIMNVAQAKFIGSAYFATTANCLWTRTNTALGAFGTDTDCPAITVDQNPGPGVIQTSDTDLPQITINNLPAGTYRISVDGGIDDAAGVQGCIAISDGTDIKGRSCGVGDRPAAIEAVFTYTTSGNRTFSIFGAQASGAIELENAVQNIATWFHIYRYPSANEIAITADQTDWGPTDLGAITVTSSGGSVVKGTMVRDKIIGRRIGKYLHLDIQYEHSTAGTTGTGDYYITIPNSLVADTTLKPAFGTTLSNANARDLQKSLVGYGHWGVTGGARGPGNCWLITSTTIGCATMNTFSSYTAWGSSNYPMGTANIGFGIQVAIPIHGWVETRGSPTILNQVSTPASGGVKICSGFITNSGTPAVSSSDGNCMASVTDNGTGDTTVNFASGTFSSTPRCNCDSYAAAGQGPGCAPITTTAVSSSLVRIGTHNTTTAVARDNDFFLICVGPR